MFEARPVLASIGSEARQVFLERTPTLLRGPDGQMHTGVADLCESVWMVICAYLNQEGADTDQLDSELRTIPASLPGFMVNAWIERIGRETDFDPQTHLTLGKAVVYLVEGFRADSELEIEDYDRLAENIHRGAA